VTISRKEFFRQGIFSLGDTLLKATGILQQPAAGAGDDAVELPHGDQPMVALPRNERCLAKKLRLFQLCGKM